MDSISTNCKSVITVTVLKCPHCGVEQKTTIPLKGKKMEQDCRFCNQTMVAKEGSHCVFCSFGSIKCTAMQKREYLLNAF
jgi:hypothetical protein